MYQQEGYFLRLERDQDVTIKGTLLHPIGNTFKTHDHVMVLEKDTK